MCSEEVGSTGERTTTITYLYPLYQTKSHCRYLSCAIVQNNLGLPDYLKNILEVTSLKSTTRFENFQ